MCTIIAENIEYMLRSISEHLELTVRIAATYINGGVYLSSLWAIRLSTMTVIVRAASKAGLRVAIVDE